MLKFQVDFYLSIFFFSGFSLSLILFDELHYFFQAGSEFLEILLVNEYLMLLEINLGHIGITRNQFLAFCDAYVHVILSILLYIYIINTVSGFDSLGK